MAQRVCGGRASRTAFASSTVICGRRCHSRHVASVTSPMLKSGKRRSVNVFTPRNLAAKSSSMYFDIPFTIDTTAIRNITPIVTPSSVKKLFSFCTRICVRASRIASRSDMDSLRAARAERGEECFAGFVRGNTAIAKHDHAPRVRRNVLLVRHHDHRLPGGRELLEHTHDLLGCRAVQVSGRLV